MLRTQRTAMPRNFEDSTLWKVSAFERMWAETGNSGFARLGGSTSLSATLQSELSGLRSGHHSSDAVEVVAACMRRRESALILLRHNDLVWPLTLFPERDLYHLPRPIVESLESGNLDLQVIAVEAPGLQAPHHLGLPGAPARPNFRPLAPLLWALALHAPAARLLPHIAGRAAYRLVAGYTPESSALKGAMVPAVQRLGHEIASLDQIAHWPGMDRERAVRLLNALYFNGGLRVLRSHAAARNDAGPAERFKGWWRTMRGS